MLDREKLRAEFKEFLNEAKYIILKTKQIGKYAIVAFIDPNFKGNHIAVFVGKETEEPKSSKPEFNMTGNIPEKYIEDAFEKVVKNVKTGKESHIAIDI